jgi:hypothetical protein
MLVSRTRLVWTLLLLTAVAAVAVGYYYTEYLAHDHYIAGLGRIDAYSVGEPPTVLTIYFTVGAGDIGEDASVTEDSRAVTVRANTSVFSPGTGRFKNLAGYPKQATVTLKRPVGDRIVIDGGTGRTVPLSPGQQ